MPLVRSMIFAGVVLGPILGWVAALPLGGFRR
jgi:hypothetical protein